MEEEENDFSPYSVGTFEDVKDYVNNRILKGQEAVSMRILHNLFGVACDDKLIVLGMIFLQVYPKDRS